MSNRLEQLPKTIAFIHRVKADADNITDAAKEHWKRPRPITINPTLVPDAKEKSFSYPSGHSTEGTVMALVLAELCPDRSETILATGRGIGWRRVEIGRHYPTDIYAGRTLARAIVAEMKKSAKFQRQFAEAKNEIAAVRATALAK